MEAAVEDSIDVEASVREDGVKVGNGMAIASREAVRMPLSRSRNICMKPSSEVRCPAACARSCNKSIKRLTRSIRCSTIFIVKRRSSTRPSIGKFYLTGYTVTINGPFSSKLHRDANNYGPSLVIAFGKSRLARPSDVIDDSESVSKFDCAVRAHDWAARLSTTK